MKWPRHDLIPRIEPVHVSVGSTLKRVDYALRWRGRWLVKVNPPVSARPDIAWKWRKWTIGFWTDPDNWTFFGIDLLPLEIVWRQQGYRP